jgi:Ni/Fe-hydrogenase 1 B-type cytochrome subunit
VSAAVERGVAPAPRRVLVYVWELPVRILHWTIVLTIVCLTLSGLYIAHPLIVNSDPGVPLLADIRLAHIVCGCVFAVALVARVVWAFLGNRYAGWRQFLPVEPERRAQILPSLRYYGFLRSEPPAVVGHNPLAALAYVGLYGLFCVQIVTGLALESLTDRGGWLWTLTGWVFDLATIPSVTLIHYLITFLIAGFVVNHVYSSLLVDFEERSGLVSSIVTGWKSIPRERL